MSRSSKKPRRILLFDDTGDTFDCQDGDSVSLTDKKRKGSYCAGNPAEKKRKEDEYRYNEEDDEHSESFWTDHRIISVSRHTSYDKVKEMIRTAKQDKSWYKTVTTILGESDDPLTKLPDGEESTDSEKSKSREGLKILACKKLHQLVEMATLLPFATKPLGLDELNRLLIHAFPHYKSGINKAFDNGKLRFLLKPGTSRVAFTKASVDYIREQSGVSKEEYYSSSSSDDDDGNDEDDASDSGRKPTFNIICQGDTSAAPSVQPPHVACQPKSRAVPSRPNQPPFEGGDVISEADRSDVAAIPDSNLSDAAAIPDAGSSDVAVGHYLPRPRDPVFRAVMRDYRWLCAMSERLSRNQERIG